MDDWFADKKPWEDHTSTEYMDGIRTEKDYLDRNKLVVRCANCTEWHHFERTDKSSMSATEGQVCACGSKSFLGSTIISERTWRPDIKKPKLKR